MLRDLLQRVDKTVLLVTHDLDEALYLAQRIVFLGRGRGSRRSASRGGSALGQTCMCEEYVAAVHRGGRTGSDMQHFFHAHGWEIARLTFEHLWLTAQRNAARGRHRPAARHPADAPTSGLAKPVIGVREYRPDHSRAWPSSVCCCPCRGSAKTPRAWRSSRSPAMRLLPILRNTYAGIRSVDPALDDVANALGMTGCQRLFKVELPLAASVILAGLAHGDGDLRRRRDHCRRDRRRRPGRTYLPRRRSRRQLAGAGRRDSCGTACAGCGCGLGWLETPLGGAAMNRSRVGIACGCLMAFLSAAADCLRAAAVVADCDRGEELYRAGRARRAACAGDRGGHRASEGRAAVLSCRSYICQQALISGRIDAYVEYTGTALTAILKQPLPPPGQRDARRVLATVRELYASALSRARRGAAGL